MEELLAGAALLLGQLVVGAVDDGVADAALLDAVELLVHVLLPDLQTLQDRAVLVGQVRGQLDEPVAPLLLADAESPHRRDLDHAQRVVGRQLDDQLHVQLLHLVCGHDLATAQHA